MESPLEELICDNLLESIAVLSTVMSDSHLQGILTLAATATASALKSGHKLMLAGNGGSAADAQHLAAEFVSRLVKNRPAMRAIALTTDTSVLTAIGNDYGYASIFERQLEAIAQPGDVFLGISTSGSSPNILRAMEASNKLGVVTIGFTGKTGGGLVGLCDHCVQVASDVTMRIQEAHLVLEHIFCMLVECAYFNDRTTTMGSSAFKRIDPADSSLRYPIGNLAPLCAVNVQPAGVP